MNAMFFAFLAMLLPAAIGAKGFPKAPDHIVLVRIDAASFKLMGEFPPNRLEYAKLVNKVKESRPAAIYLDVFFIRPTRDDEKGFSDELNKKQAIITCFPFSDIEANYEKGRASLGGKVAGFPAKRPFGFSTEKGIEFPYPPVLQKSKVACAAFAVFGEHHQVRQVGLYSFYKDALYENCPVVICNEYLAPKGYQLGLSSDHNRFVLRNLKDLGRNTALASRKFHFKDLVVPLNFYEFPKVTAEDVLSGKWSGKEGSIVLIGSTTSAVGDRHSTPFGVVYGIELVANKVATLLELAEQGIASIEK